MIPLDRLCPQDVQENTHFAASAKSELDVQNQVEIQDTSKVWIQFMNITAYNVVSSINKVSWTLG